MPNPDPHVQIARKLQSMETAKVELVRQVAEVLHAIQRGSEREMTQTLGGVVAVTYFLAHQLGLSFTAVDRAAAEGLPRSLLVDAVDVADFETIQRHLGTTR
ncbi:hypothetical protein JI721_06165 [Alicyclobacillus cycloheptanicus]|uniref:Methionine synthase I (Cobalamin-dependent) n=1 Tax=Alicyclobacillus cycloheptanicus TaxID=1457 RepID=A0ABT9XKU9_9BACL|nr:MazG-like family protein [Alicyclobacillus cycloheptanicus]MDQ0190931.1 methionine synthase I (cobalamin-dependent) [Alicyclobacillus cycloheptanicus]WDM02381.1 hypothetical protein JI721_06165 [Alicyclobacillus cycloheptanicus]